jgi:cytochrome P450
VRPRDDLLSALVAAEEAGDKLTEQELFTTLILLLIAGHETTVNLIGNGLLALLRDRDALARLRDDPAIERTAIEELLRYDAPVQMTIRTLLDDYEAGGRVVKKGQQAVALLGSANRDPAAFDSADRLVLDRADNAHLAFGHGTHFCLGAPLARLEGQIALTSVVRRFDLELHVDEPPYKENIVLRGLASLPVVVRPR